MKKLILMLLVITCVSALILGCQSSAIKDPSDTGTSELPEYKPGSIVLGPQEFEDHSSLRKYRTLYYRIWGEFEDLLSEDEKIDMATWFESHSASVNNGDTAEEMILVSFIKRYNITRKEFDTAVEKFIANRIGADFNHEENEIPNGDIIYSFDNEIINRYYRYE